MGFLKLLTGHRDLRRIASVHFFPQTSMAARIMPGVTCIKIKKENLTKNKLR
ncbi:hypothetical protein DOJK_01984 [Patescibacteria group bacterium]|nr:hypothetical protein DOJK_01984 [Patescibacteria group bacterium]